MNVGVGGAGVGVCVGDGVALGVREAGDWVVNPTTVGKYVGRGGLGEAVGEDSLWQAEHKSAKNRINRFIQDS